MKHGFFVRKLREFVLGKFICVNFQNLRMLSVFNPRLKNFSGLSEMAGADSNEHAYS